MQTIVIGHRNPDMDSICSAVVYAELKRRLGMTDVTAARAGNTNERIDYVLQRFGVPAPPFISDLTPRVADIMETKVVSVPDRTSIYQAMASPEFKRLRAVPVVDDDNRFLGLLSGWKMSRFLFPPREETANSRQLEGSVADIVQALDGQVLAGEANSDRRSLIIMVAAMSVPSFAARLQRYETGQVVLFVGDREDIQLAAIDAGALAIVITGGLSVSAAVRSRAREKRVLLISSQFDTATSVMLSRGAVRVERMVDTNFTSFGPDASLRSARQLVANSADMVFPVIDGDRQLVGMLTKSDFLKPIPRQLILVDHNELSQAVRGASEIPIIEILDHHRIGGLSTDLPILFWNNPVGSTSTLVALAYRQYGVNIDPPMAGLLLAGLISDTLNLTSPTATDIDRQISDELGRLAGVSAARLSEEIFSVGSPLRTLAPKDVITADCKDYDEAGRRFSISQIEELNFTAFCEKKGELFNALEAYRAAQNAYFAALLVTDVNTQNSLLLLAGPPELSATITYPQLEPSLFELNGVVSRKKQLLPFLLDCLHKAEAAAA
ncbi:MAG: putative manganese-dependent inorganic diphosphatase [Verrucomicrobia bacterium]|nr:putative manganese-dependent inorganic diphosphatase [Verrucomicrobiota bacterium]